MVPGGNNFYDFPEKQLAIFRAWGNYNCTSQFAGTLQYRRSGCDKQCLPESQSASPAAGTVLRRIPEPQLLVGSH